MPRPEKNDYAVYKGDEFLFVGTGRECAAYLDIKLSSFRYLLSPAYTKRTEKFNDPLIVFKVEDE